uniref:C2H2-type domain-containing protein n=1 Tax=Trichobilharzia regenti TaxID=157069 RepID=A0AA85JFG4_TRIRE|nr:unnamed protein product [Trichobilharzia regenti]
MQSIIKLNTGYSMNPNYGINMNHSSVISSEFKLLPDCLNPFLLMNFNNMYDNMSNSNINNNNNNNKGHSMHSTLRTPSPTIQHQQQSEVGGVFLTSTPVWRKQKEYQHENLNKSLWLSGEQQAGEMQTAAENMKLRKYSRHSNRFGYSRNKVLQAQKKLQRKFNNHIVVNSDLNGNQNAGHNNNNNNNINKQRMHRSSSGRRRRVGWRGTTICANCGMIFEGMNHLNHHYSLVHGHLLTSELTSTQYSNNKTSKLLFQAQLDLLISEKASKDGCPTSTTSSSSTLSTSDDNIQQSKSSLQPPPSSSSSGEAVVISGECINSPYVESTSTTTTTATLMLTTMTTLPTTGIQHIKSYPCPKCNYTAKWPTELQKHVMVHANSRPFVCCVCTTSYKWSWDLGRHFTNSHPNLPNPYKRQRNINNNNKKQHPQQQQQQPQQPQQQQREEPSTLKQEDL